MARVSLIAHARTAAVPARPVRHKPPTCHSAKPFLRRPPSDKETQDQCRLTFYLILSYSSDKLSMQLDENMEPSIVSTSVEPHSSLISYSKHSLSKSVGFMQKHWREYARITSDKSECRFQLKTTTRDIACRPSTRTLFADQLARGLSPVSGL